jgi:hypothetical protein
MKRGNPTTRKMSTNIKWEHGLETLNRDRTVSINGERLKVETAVQAV